MSTSLIFGLLFSCLVFSYAEEDRKQKIEACLTDNKLTKQQYREMYFDEVKSEEFHCAGKCILEALGQLKDGKIDFENIKKPEYIPEEIHNKSIECLKKIEEIPSCNDITKVFDCIPKPEFTEAEKSCMAEHNIAIPEFLSNVVKSPPEQSQKFLCASKCAVEKGEYIKDGKPDVDRMRKPEFMTEEKFMETKACVSKVPEVLVCDDMKEFIQCFKQPYSNLVFDDDA